MTESRATQPQITEVRIRRAPRLPVFLLLGGILGVIIALIATALGNVDPKVGFAGTFGYLCIYFIPIGIVVGALVGLLLDRISIRRARLVSVEQQAVERPPAEQQAPLPAEPQQPSDD